MKVWLSALVLALVCAGCATSSSVPSQSSGEGCRTPLGFILEGKTAFGYLNPVESAGQSCKRGPIACENGTWSGAYIHPTCVVTP